MSIVNPIANLFDLQVGDPAFQELQRLAREKASVHEDVIDISMINSDLEPHRYIVDKLAEATIKYQNHRYAVARGIRKLRDAFAYRYSTNFDVVLDSESQICVTQGAKDAIVQVLSLLGMGKRRTVLIGAPYYPVHFTAAKLAGLQVNLVPLTGDTTIDEASWCTAMRNPDVAACLMNYPSNPCGSLVTADFWKRVSAYAAQNDIVLINDFVYGELAFNEKGRAPSLLASAAPNSMVVEVYSLSKAFSVAGWRVGALVGNAQIVQAVSKRKSFTGFGLFLPLQLASASLLTSQQDLISPVRAAYEQRVRFVSAGLKQIGWDVARAEAGICVWAKPPGDESNTYKLSETILKQQNVFLSPGAYFGSNDRFLRFACVQPQARLQTLLDRLSQAVL